MAQVRALVREGVLEKLMRKLRAEAPLRNDLPRSSARIDLVSQNSAVHHHRDHDDTVRPHAEIGAALRERKEARRLAIVRNVEQAAAYPVGDKIAALAIGLDTIEIAGRC